MRDRHLQIIAIVRIINRAIALVCGVILLLTVVFVISEITLRSLGLRNLGGADELLGYVMAFVASWGLPVALSERAHIRIQTLVASRLNSFWRDVADVLACLTIATVATTVVAYGWTVLSKSFEAGSRANTPLETPLWIPQIMWWSGWVWFSVSACLVTMIAFSLLVRRRSGDLRNLASTEQ